MSSTLPCSKILVQWEKMIGKLNDEDSYKNYIYVLLPSNSSSIKLEGKPYHAFKAELIINLYEFVQKIRCKSHFVKSLEFQFQSQMRIPEQKTQTYFMCKRIKNNASQTKYWLMNPTLFQENNNPIHLGPIPRACLIPYQCNSLL